MPRVIQAVLLASLAGGSSLAAQPRRSIAGRVVQVGVVALDRARTPVVGLGKSSSAARRRPLRAHRTFAAVTSATAGRLMVLVSTISASIRRRSSASKSPARSWRRWAGRRLAVVLRRRVGEPWRVLERVDGEAHRPIAGPPRADRPVPLQRSILNPYTSANSLEMIGPGEPARGRTGTPQVDRLHRIRRPVRHPRRPGAGEQAAAGWTEAVRAAAAAT